MPSFFKERLIASDLDFTTWELKSVIILALAGFLVQFLAEGSSWRPVLVFGVLS